MPIYEYSCSSCGKIFEILTTSSNKAEAVRCSKCQSDKVHKILSAGSLRRGTGTRPPTAAASGCSSKSGFS